MIASILTVIGLATIAAILVWLNCRAHCHRCRQWFRFKAGQNRAAWVYHAEYSCRGRR